MITLRYELVKREKSEQQITLVKVPKSQHYEDFVLLINEKVSDINKNLLCLIKSVPILWELARIVFLRASGGVNFSARVA